MITHTQKLTYEIVIKLLKGKLGRTRSISERRGHEKATSASNKTKDQQQASREAAAQVASKATRPATASAGNQKDTNLLSSN